MKEKEGHLPAQFHYNLVEQTEDVSGWLDQPSMGLIAKKI